MELISFSSSASQHLPYAALNSDYSASTWEQGQDSTACLLTDFPTAATSLADCWVSRMDTYPPRNWLILRGHFLWVSRQVSHNHWSLSHPGFRPLIFIWKTSTWTLTAFGVVQPLGRRQLPSSSCVEKSELPQQFLKLESRWYVPKPVSCLAVQMEHSWEHVLRCGDYPGSLRPGTCALISMLLQASCMSWDLAQTSTCPDIRDVLSQARTYTRPWLSTQSSQTIRCSTQAFSWCSGDNLIFSLTQ